MSPGRIYNTEGIVIKRKNTGDADKFITVFTKKRGKQQLIAKGVRKITSRRGPHLELFRKISMTVNSGKSYDSISGVDTLIPLLRQDKKLDKYGFAYLVCELVDKLTPFDEENVQVYNSLEKVLVDLDRTLTVRQSVRLVSDFARNLLKTLGFAADSPVLKDSEITSAVEFIVEKKLHVPQFLHAIFQKR